MKIFIKKKFPKVHTCLVSARNYFTKFSRRSFSQFGEDIVLSTFIDKKNGFYVDVGAHHPYRFSNTYFYYRKGWGGINIDAKPGSMSLFRKKRSLDINLEIGISTKKGEAMFHTFKESAYNTFSNKLAESYIKGGADLIGCISVPTEPLENILDAHMPKDTAIDFISIDVEGMDLEVLESNNWSKYQPRHILVETQSADMDKIQQNEIYKFLINKNYRLISIVYMTLIFQHEQ